MQQDTMTQVDKGPMDALDVANIRLAVDGREQAYIPREGAVLVVVNRLFGEFDALLALSAIRTVRPDAVAFTDISLKGVGDSGIIALPKNAETRSSEISARLAEGRAVAVFPSKSIVRALGRAGIAMDKRWDSDTVRALFEARTPIIPLCLQTEALVKPLRSKRYAFDRLTAMVKDMRGMEKLVNVRIGRPIAVETQQAFAGAQEFGRYLRAKVYALGSPLEVNAFFPTLRGREKGTGQAPVAEARDADAVARELDALRPHNLLFSQERFDMFLARPDDIPSALKEIGRLRELTFREVGEGTGRPFDLDEFDIHYRQLILWDREARSIAGGYRVGLGHELFAKLGKRGFYIHTLFRVKKPFHEVMRSGIELGRSYVTPSYQRARLPLFLLWRGILSVLLRHPQYRYLFGPVSISNSYSILSRELMVAFIRKYFWDEGMARHVMPRKPFKSQEKDADVDVLIAQLGPATDQLDRLLEEIEPNHFRLPVLVKRYMQQQARIIGFNVDPAFSDALDGLMVLDISRLPQSTLENLQGELHNPEVG